MSNFYDVHHDQFDYEDGSKIVFSVRVNRKRLGQLVYEAAKNKNGKKISGSLMNEARRISYPAPEAH